MLSGHGEAKKAHPRPNSKTTQPQEIQISETYILRFTFSTHPKQHPHGHARMKPHLPHQKRLFSNTTYSNNTLYTTPTKN